MSTRVAIFGAAGQLGVELTRCFSRQGVSLLALTRKDVDITNFTRVDEILTGFNPSLVINAAAYNMVDVAEKEPVDAYLVNALAVRNMAVSCRQLDARFVHFSSDYVFDGTKGSPYLETDSTHPLGAYAVSKLGGELYAQAYLDNALVIRTSGVFGPGGRNTPRGNFIEVMLRQAASGNPIRVVEDHFASPTYSPALAERTQEMVLKGLSGLFHIGGGEAVSWHQYARLIFEEAGIRPELKATNEREYRTPARRPRFSALSNSRMESAGITPMPALRDAIRSYLSTR
jgi:dTDP-4-dehydrorhamnose reductase